ncbi:DUF1700 domain-containing protein [Tissierella creatinini]|nr:DUF1700 domain-containing protein [Tissierella creatinini]TJX67508.1 DUF1700 domain-containing protein [Soehngenia saccharolytica]
MKKIEYLNHLKTNLQGLPNEEINDILSDYEEHFQIGISKGKTEEEISHELGDPKEIAAGYKLNLKSNQPSDESTTTTTNDNTKRFLVALLLIIVNVMVLSAPVMALLGILVGLFGMGIGFAFGGLGLLLRLPFVLIGNSPHILTSLGLGFGLGALGLLVLILGAVIVKHLIILIKKYVKWNIELVNR